MGDELVIRRAAACACNGSCACATRAAAVAPIMDFDVPYPVTEYPDVSVFDRPDWLEPGQRLTITDNGQVGGYFYEKGVCIIDPRYPDECWQPPPSPTRYAAFHQQDVVTSDGELRQQYVGAVGNVGGHASPFSTISVAQRVYADPRVQMMLLRAGDDETGGWVAGTLVPGLTYGDVAFLRRCALSGDWRPFEQQWWSKNEVPRAAAAAAQWYDCLGPTLVTRPGLPMISAFRQRAAAADARPVYLGGAGGVQLRADAQTQIASATATTEGDTTMDTPTLRLPDGTEIDLPTGASIVNREGSFVVNMPTAAEVAGDTTASNGAGTTTEEPPPGPTTTDLASRLDELAGRVDDHGSFVEQQRAAEAAALERALADVADPVALPATETA